MDYQFFNEENDFSFYFQRDEDTFLMNNDFDADFDFDSLLVQPENTCETQDSLQTQDEYEIEKRSEQTITQEKGKRRRAPKEIIELNQYSMRFYKNMCYILKGSSEETIRKEIVLKYHKIACQRNHMIRKVKRDEYRSINKYFNAFIDQQYLILQTFQEMINEGIINYEEDYRVLVSKKLL